MSNVVEEKKTYRNKDKQPFWLNLNSIRLKNENSEVSLGFRDGYPRFVISKNAKVSGNYMDNNIFIRMDGVMLGYVAAMIRDVANNLKNDEEIDCLYGYDNNGNKVDVNVVDGTVRVYRGEDNCVWLMFTHYNEAFKYQLKPDNDWFKIRSGGIDVTDKPSTSKRYAVTYANILEALITDATVATSNSYSNTK